MNWFKKKNNGNNIIQHFNEGQWDKTFNAISDLIFILDKDCVIAKANTAFMNALRLEPKDVIGKKCFVLMHKSDNPWHNCPNELTKKDGKAHTEEVFDPNIGIPLLVTTSPIFDDKGEFSGSVHIAKDISERKKLEEALAIEKEWYRALFYESRDAVMTLSPKQGFMSGNQAAIKLFGCRDEGDFKSRSPSSLSPEYQPDGVLSSRKTQEMMGLALKNGSHFFEWKHKRVDGSEFMATVLLSRIGFLKHELLQATVRDITEENRFKDQIKAARDYAETIFELTPSAIFIVDTNRMVTAWNKKAEQITGYSAKEIIGKECLDFAEVPCKNKCGLYSEDIKKPVTARECTIRRKDGTIRIIQKNADLLRDSDGHVVGGIESFDDITERKRAEEVVMHTKKELEEQSWGLKKTNEGVKILYKELEKANEQLQKIDLLKSQFVSHVSHELRTPLSAIKESVNIVLDGTMGPLDEKQKEVLDIAKRNLDRLARLINDVLDFQKLEAGKMVFKFDENDINSVAKEAYNAMQPLVKQKGLDFILKLEENLPMVKLDRDKIVQVFTNFINNALKFTENGSITIVTSLGNNIVKVGVKDTGLGMKKEDLSKLFRQFEQLDNPEMPKAKGTGLGLAISRQIIEAHKGKIWVESELGQGSAFYFVLPFQEQRV